MENILSFDQFILEKKSEITDAYLKLSKKDKEYLLEMDKQYGKLASLFRQVYRAKNVMNTDKEFKKFIDARRSGKKYYPVLELDKVESDVDIKSELEELLEKFKNFSSYISKFYVEKIEGFLSSIEHSEEHEKLSQSDEKPKKPENPYDRGGSFPTKDEYEHALQIIHEHPYEVVKAGVRNIGAKEAADKFQKYLDKLGYDYKVDIVDGMLPRVNVTPDGIVRVNPDAHFSDEDIEGLYQHELEGHVGRRYYGYQTGLHLFVFGLPESNTYDEGLAIWNSLNKVKKPKPNILFNIAIKAIITYHLYDMDFCELFDFVKTLCPDMGDKTCFKSIVRMKRGVKDCKLYGGALESGYFNGYKYVEAMTDEERDDILKYNIGPDQMSELDKIKKFIEVNDFKPIPVPINKKVDLKENYSGITKIKATDSTIRDILKVEIEKYGKCCSLNHIDVSGVTNMDSLFYQSDFNGDISRWDVSGVKNMFAMFRESAFNGDISNWDVSSVGDMSYMFACSSFNGDISRWDVSSVVYMTGLFMCSVFNQDVSQWKPNKCKFMNYAFMGSAFNGDLSHWNTSSVKHLSNAFEKSVFNGDISNWDVSNVENMRCCFRDSLFSGDVSKWKVKKGTKTIDCFKNSGVDTNLIKWL